MIIYGVFFFEYRLINFRGENALSFLYRYIRETVYTPWRPCFLTDQIHICYFCRGSLRDHL